MAKKTTRPKGATERQGPVCPGDLNLPQPTREDYVASVLEQIAEFEEKILELETGLESAGWDDIGDYRSQFDNLRSRLRDTRAKAAELEGVPDREWSDSYKEMEETLLDLAGNVKDLSVTAGGVLPEET